MLSVTNIHELDYNLMFDQSKHKYNITIDPNVKYTSCTSLINSYFNKFNAHMVATAIVKANKNPLYKDMTVSQIKQQWNATSYAASCEGTKMHQNIENFLNGNEVDCGEQFMNWYNTHGKNLKPYRTEWMIYDFEFKIAGTIDYVTLNEDGTIDLWDWKRCKSIAYTGTSKGLTPLQSILNCNYNHYSLQLNVYKTILERNYGLKVHAMYLCILHPDYVDDPIIPVSDMTEHVLAMFKHQQPKCLI